MRLRRATDPRAHRALLAVLAVACHFDGSGAGPQGDGLADAKDASTDPPGWRRRRTLTLTNPGAEPLSGVPVPVVLTPQRIDYSAVRSDGSDLLFVGTGGTVLAHELERWQSGGTSIVWLRVPELAPGSTPLSMYHGHDTPPASTATAVWSADYQAVWHLGESGNSGVAITNSAQTSHSGLTDGTLAGAGVLGGGRAFQQGGNHRVAFATSGALLSGWNRFSIEFWLYPDYASDTLLEAQEGMFLHKGGPVRLGRIFRNGQPAGHGRVQIDIEFAPGGTLYLGADVMRQQWSYLVFDFDGGVLRVYRDGMEQVAANAGSALRTDSGDLSLGASSGAVNGTLDEVRIAAVSRSPAWIRLQNLAMRDGLITYGEETVLAP